MKHPWQPMKLALPAMLLLGILGAVPSFADTLVQASVAGGGTSLSASDDQRFRLSGTIGPMADLKMMQSANEQFSLQPGFWHRIRIEPTPEAPRITIRPGPPGMVILAWRLDVTGFLLEETDNLASGTWKAPLVRIVDTDSEHTVTVPASGFRCFRLRKP